MPITNASEVASYDADAAVEAVRETVEGTLYSVIEFDQETYNSLYVDDATLAFYENRDHMDAHFADIHSYTSIDFNEIDLFTEELFPVADRVDYKTTTMDFLKIVRIYTGRDGLFVALDPEEPVVPIVETIKDHM